jgi:hypothetical protein
LLDNEIEKLLSKIHEPKKEKRDRITFLRVEPLCFMDCNAHAASAYPVEVEK